MKEISFCAFGVSSSSSVCIHHYSIFCFLASPVDTAFSRKSSQFINSLMQSLVLEFITRRMVPSNTRTTSTPENQTQVNLDYSMRTIIALTYHHFKVRAPK